MYLRRVQVSIEVLSQDDRDLCLGWSEAPLEGSESIRKIPVHLGI